MLGTVVAATIIEKAGRKQLLVNSYLGQAAAMLLMAAGFVSPALSGYSGAIAVRTCHLEANITHIPEGANEGPERACSSNALRLYASNCHHQVRTNMWQSKSAEKEVLGGYVLN